MVGQLNLHRSLIEIEYVLRKHNKQICFELFDLDSPLFCPRHHINELSENSENLNYIEKLTLKYS